MIREINESRCTRQITWDDVPHLTEDAKDQMRRTTPDRLLSAREQGIPAIGSGRIFQISIREIMVRPFYIPAYWPRIYALDPGWRRTAALWAAWDRETDTIYLYSEHYMSQALPSTHAQSIKTRGDWIPGLIDPAARGRSVRDGERIYNDYVTLGLNLILAKNAVESGIYQCQELLYQGRLRVFDTLQNFVDEFNYYRRDDNGKIIKENDHLMDCMRYVVADYERYSSVKPVDREVFQRFTPGIGAVGY